MKNPRILMLSLMFFSMMTMGCGRAPVAASNPTPLPMPNFTPGKYNVILVSLDTLRADHLGAYGYGRKTSPCFDGLAQRSVLFEDCEAQAPHTRPSHLSMFQSRNPAFCGDNYPMLAEILHKAGYRTDAFTDGGHLSAKLGFSRGFDSYREYGKGFTASFADIKAWLEDPPDQPFFLFVHSYDIHLPYDPPAPFDTMFTDPDYSGPIKGENTRDLAWRIRHRQKYKDLKEKVVVPSSDRDQYTALYDGGICFTDQYLGKLETVLRQQNLWESSIFIVFSDHGEEFWDHASVSHGHTLYHELLHVPLLIHFPGDAYGGMRVSSTVRLLDLSPTIVGLTGLEAEKNHQGMRLIPDVFGYSGEKPIEMPALAEVARQKAIRQGRWKLILNTKTGELQLFDLEEDPGELQSLALLQPQVARRMLEELKRIYGALENSDIDVDKAAEDVTDPELREQLRALGYIE